MNPLNPRSPSLTVAIQLSHRPPSSAAPPPAASANGQPGTICSAAAATLETGECLDLTTILGPDNAALLTESQRSLVGSLLSLDQQHLFEDWPPAGEADAEKKQLMEQLESLDGSYPGGLSTYITKARDLLEASARGDNPFEGFVPSVPRWVNRRPLPLPTLVSFLLIHTRSTLHRHTCICPVKCHAISIPFITHH